MKGKYLLAVTAIALLLSGCGQTKEETKQQAEKVPLTIWCYYETDAQQAGMDWLANGFNMEQDEYEISWEYVPMTEFSKKLAMAYTEEGLPDLAIIDNPNMSMCIQTNMCEDITEFAERLGVQDTYYPAALEPVMNEERIYGIPVTCNNVALIYNKKMFQEAGVEPPQSWEELKEAAEKLTTDTTDGFLLSAIEGEQGAFQLLPWILSAEEERTEIEEEGIREAFSYLYELMEKGYMTENCINMSQTDVARMFINEKTAMMENGPWILPMLEEAGIDYGICKLPVNRVIVGGEDLAVMKGKNLAGAKLFLKYYNQKEIMNKFCEMTSGISPKIQENTNTEDVLDIFREQMDNAVVRSAIPYWNKLSKALPEEFYHMTVGEESSEKAAEHLKTENLE